MAGAVSYRGQQRHLELGLGGSLVCFGQGVDNPDQKRLDSRKQPYDVPLFVEAICTLISILIF